MTITLKQSFEESADAILAIGALDTSATDPTASTAEGEGLTVANVGVVSEFVVTAVEVGAGEQRSIGGDTVVIKLVSASTSSVGEASGSGGGVVTAKGKRKHGGGGGGGVRCVLYGGGVWWWWWWWGVVFAVWW